MKDREYCEMVKTVTFITLIFVALPMAGLAAELSLKLGHVTPSGSLYDVAATKFSERLAANTRGKAEIIVYGNAQLGSPPEHWVQVKAGVMDFYVEDIGVASVVEPEPKNFDVVKAPYLFESQERFHAFLQSDLFKSMIGKVERANNLKYVSYLGDRPARGFSTTKKRATIPDDIKGLKLRVPPEPIFVAMYKAWGANPTPVAPKEVYTSLKSGLVDGVDLNMLDLWLAKYHEIQKFFMPIEYMMSGMGCWTSAKKWESFSEDVRAALLKSAQETEIYVNASLLKQMGEAEKAFKQAGLEIVHLDLKPWKEIAEKEVQKNDGKLWEKGLYDKVKAIK